MSAGYEKAIRSKDGVPHAQVVFDPFHVCQLGSKATDQVRRAEYNQHGRSGTDTGKWINGVRYSLLKDPSNQSATQLLRLAEVQQTNKRMFRAFLLNGELRYVYKGPQAPSARAPRRVARVGVPLKAETVRQARAHHHRTAIGDRGRDPDRAEQRVSFILHLLVGLWW